ncbi:nudC domain-containing protein 2-like [Dysidea avara]|uniref:nudC domain-containing protein 2-like n=1 Tax=Dysidea avara TaxID=196820 RepID=UPI0033336D96
MSLFEEKSGVVVCKTDWGSWAQTIDDVMIEVNVPKGTKSREIKCNITPKSLTVSVQGKEIIKGDLYTTVLADECVWTIEDGSLLRIVLVKSNRDAANCWKSLLLGKYEADLLAFNNMEKKLTLERFQREHPGFDFSGADISGQYSGGGPRLD